MYAFFLDIDGTIYDGKIVAQEVIDAIVRARAAGHKVFINTARAYVGMPKQVYTLPVDGFVNSYGLEVFADGKFIHRKFIPRERVLEIAKYAFDNGVKLYFEGEIRIDINNYREDSQNPDNMDEFCAMLGEHQMCKFVFCDMPTDADKAAFESDYDFYGIEVIAKGYCKSRGIHTVEEYYGISRENTVAIGDTDPDIDMVSYAGIGISMGNGTPKLKACAKYVTKSYVEFGVAYAIDCLLNGKLDVLKK
ncbi:MAG: HAD-IIB family hydrolase [Clostridia bacterium]|nr:HAD-IIB family hydrolase [Clostridia bacterium]